jgi:hypothetical protein
LSLILNSLVGFDKFERVVSAGGRRRMNFEFNHRNLNLFWHFGDSAENENNTTRAFLIAASRSPWSSILLRGFSDLVFNQVRERNTDLAKSIEPFLREWPETVEFSLERDIAAESFPGPGVLSAVIVELTPECGVAQEEIPLGELEPRGRVDATIVLRNAEGNGLAFIVESKLYHRAGRDQLERYRKNLALKGIPTALIAMSWEQVYAITHSLPAEATHDAIMSDFRSFLERDTRLTGFTGFRMEDFSPENDALDEKLQRYCNKLVASAASDSRFNNATLQRKRGGLDYDILLANQSMLIGNLGVATWEGDALYAKLVVGWRRRWQTDRLLSSGRESSQAHRMIADIAGRYKLEVQASLRPFFSRFEYPTAARWSSGTISANHAAEMLSDALSFTERFHGKQIHKAMMKEAGDGFLVITDNELLKRAFEERVNWFVPVDFVIHWEPREIAARRPGEQIELLREALSELASVLFELSGQTETVSKGVGA